MILFNFFTLLEECLNEIKTPISLGKTFILYIYMKSSNNDKLTSS